MHNSRLLRPLLYFKIEHQFKRVYDIIIPSIISLAVLIVFPVFSFDYKLLEIAKSTSTLLVVLPGFYIAALAAIATFKSSKIDNKIDGIDPPRLYSSENGYMKLRTLSRRRFLCFLFGYLSFISIVICMFNIFICIFSPHIPVCTFKYSEILIYIISFVYIFLLSHMLITTFLGLFYLCDRLHWPSVPSSDEED